MLRPNENKNAPQGNVAQGRGGVVGRKTGGRWSELPISDEELVRRYQAGAGVKALAKQLGTNHVKILRRIRATCGVIKGRQFGNKNAVKEKFAGKTVAAWQYDAWKGEWKQNGTEWKSSLDYEDSAHFGRWDYGSQNYYRRKNKRHREKKSNYYIARLLRTRVWTVLKGIRKSKPTLTMLGCTLEQFRQHMQAQFKRGMAWNNMGSHWHIDHIIPCSAFDLSKPEQQAICFHYTNMQPLEAKRNLAKRAKVIDAQYKLRI